MATTTRIARLDSKQEYLRKSLKSEISDDNKSLKSIAKTPRRKRIGRLQLNGQPKLFGGSLEEYLEASNQEIPLIIKSCIRVINLYGKFLNFMLEFLHSFSVIASNVCYSFSY